MALCWFSETIRDSFRPLSEMASLKATSVFRLSSIALFFEEKVSNDALEVTDMVLDTGLGAGVKALEQGESQ